MRANTVTMQAMAATSDIQVMIVEDETRTREAIEMLLEDTAGYRCCGAYGSVEEALEASPPAPDVMLQDIHLPGMQGSEAVPKFRELYPQTKILMFTVFAEESHVFESICNGADGYLLKKTSPERLLSAIGEAHREGTAMSPEIARKVIKLFQQTQSQAQPDHDLNPTEVRILKLLSEGYSYRGVGERLNLATNTIRWYIRAIYQKLHVHTKSEAVAKALRQGIL